MTIKYDEEIFEGEDLEVPLTIIWWLINDLGGKVEIQGEDFWENLPRDRHLVMYKEDGRVILEAERLDHVGN
jgi:hypothetical protein